MPLTLQDLERRIWSAADALRGPVEHADFKSYILPILFYKRISDVYLQERTALESEWGTGHELLADPDMYTFFVPPGSSWEDLRKVTRNLGSALQDNLDAIENANENLAGIFGDVAWANQDRLPEEALVKLVDSFSAIPLDTVSAPGDMLGDAYEYLLKQFADDSGKKAGEFYTPRGIVHLLTLIADVQPGEDVLDPTCGSGGILVEAFNTVKQTHGESEARTLLLFGQEINLTTAAIARMNLILHGMNERSQIRRGNTLTDPQFLDNESHLRQFDRVLANPPFSIKNWGSDRWESDRYGRNLGGTPTNGNADWAFLQHIFSSLKPDGVAAVVQPHGVLFRGGVEGRIRQHFIENGYIRAIVGLPSNLFYSTSIPSCIVVFQRPDADRRSHGSVLFVDASRRYSAGKAMNVLADSDVSVIHEIYRDASSGEDFDDTILQHAATNDLIVRRVSLNELKQAGYTLNIGQYLAAQAEEDVDVPAAIREMAEASVAAERSQKALIDILRGAGYEW